MLLTRPLQNSTRAGKQAPSDHSHPFQLQYGNTKIEVKHLGGGPMNPVRISADADLGGGRRALGNLFGSGLVRLLERRGGDGHGVGLPGPRYPQQYLVLLPVKHPADQRFDRRPLVPLRFVVTDEFEIHESALGS